MKYVVVVLNLSEFEECASAPTVDTVTGPFDDEESAKQFARAQQWEVEGALWQFVVKPLIP